jgi:hypothetical protein
MTIYLAMFVFTDTFEAPFLAATTNNNETPMQDHHITFQNGRLLIIFHFFYKR